MYLDFAAKAAGNASCVRYQPDNIYCRVDIQPAILTDRIPQRAG
jgi:hypothetical protein